LKQLGTALEEQNVEAFEVALNKLNRQSAVTDKDTDRAFKPAVEKNPEQTEEFLAKHMPQYKQGGETGQPCLEREPEFSLRTFPTKPGFESGETAEGTWWVQTLGRMTMWHELKNGPHDGIPGGWRPEDLTVEMNRQGLKVTLGGKPFKPLTGDFTAQIWRKCSWWNLDEETGIFELHITKRMLSTWKSPWWAYDNIEGIGFPKFKRIPYPWNKFMEKNSWNVSGVGTGASLFAEWARTAPTEDIKKEADMEVKLPGKMPFEQEDGPGYQRSGFAEVFQDKAENFICAADEICLGLTVRQDEKTVTLQIHFDRWRWEDLKQQAPTELLLGADIWEREVCIFLQGDKQNPILWGELGGFCVPHLTTWRIVSVESSRPRQQTLGSSSPALEVILHRADNVKWDKIFTTCVQHRLMVKDPGDVSEDPERWEGLKDVPNLRRSGYDINHPDFWSYVEDYVTDTMSRTGHSSLPKKLVMA